MRLIGSNNDDISISDVKIIGEIVEQSVRGFHQVKQNF